MGTKNQDSTQEETHKKGDSQEQRVVPQDCSQELQQITDVRNEQKHYDVHEPSSTANPIGFHWNAIADFVKLHAQKEGDHLIWKKYKQVFMQPSFTDRKWPRHSHRKDIQVWWHMAKHEREVPQTHYLRKICKEPMCIEHFVQIPKKTNSVENMEPVEKELIVARFKKFCLEVNAVTGCINWDGFRHTSGYGIFKCMSRHRQAHAMAWELHNSRSVPKGMLIRHLCPIKNKSCVNPAHLTIGTAQDNSNDEKARGLLVGEKNANAKLSDAKALEIIQTFENGQSVHERARMHDVSKHTIRGIDRALRFKHLMTQQEIANRTAKTKRRTLFSREKVRQIKASFGTGSGRERAQEFKVSVSAIRHIDNGRCHAGVRVDPSEDVLQQQREKKKKLVKYFSNARARIWKHSTRYVDECKQVHWLWKGNRETTDITRRATISFFGNKNVHVHRASFLVFNNRKKVRSGMVIRHSCKFKHCVNPVHLSEGTMAQNMADKIRDGIQPRGEKHSNSKLTESTVKKIIQTKNYGTQKERGLSFNATLAQVGSIDTKGSWAWLVCDDKPDSETLEQLARVKRQRMK